MVFLRAERFRAIAQVTLIGLTVVAAACIGARGRASTATTPPATKVVDSTKRDTVTKKVDSVTRAKALSDSSLKGAAEKKDSVARQAEIDSLKNAQPKIPLKPKKPAKECILNTSESPPETRVLYTRQSDSSSTAMIGGGFVGRCEGESTVLKADSAEYFQANGFVNLFNNVTYLDGKDMRVTANHATYFLREGKLYADGNVTATQLKSGSTFRGPNMEYFRVMDGIRTTSRMYAPNSPIVTIVEKDSAGQPMPPVTVTASVMEDHGDSVLFAWGNVAIIRTDMTGRSDSASFDKPTGKARLIRGASITSTSKDQKFTLSGDTIDLFTTDSVLNRVLATHLSRAKSGDINMSSERIDLRLQDKKIERAYLFGKGRAKAEMPSQSLEADSIDAHLPDQRIQELRAFGRAVTLGKPDSIKIKSTERDELHGDTVIAVFDTAKVKGDTTSKPQLRTVTAGGNARSKVQIATPKGRTAPPAINYVRGKHMVVQFDSGQVQSIEVDSSASGQYYEPADTLSDSAKAKPAPKKKSPGKRPPADYPSESTSIELPTAFRRPE
jgi:hypothetical protein